MLVLCINWPASVNVQMLFELSVEEVFGIQTLYYKLCITKFKGSSVCGLIYDLLLVNY